MRLKIGPIKAFNCAGSDEIPATREKTRDVFARYKTQLRRTNPQSAALLLFSRKWMERESVSYKKSLYLFYKWTKRSASFGPMRQE